MTMYLILNCKLDETIHNMIQQLKRFWSWKCPHEDHTPYPSSHVTILHSKPICQKLNKFEVSWVTMHQIKVVDCDTWRKTFESTTSICLKSWLMSAQIQSTSEEYPRSDHRSKQYPAICAVSCCFGSYWKSRSYDFRLACFISVYCHTWSCVSRQRKVWRQYLIISLL